MNTKKIIVGLLAGAICFGMLSGVSTLRAQTLADTIARLPSDSSDWGKRYNDQSTYADQDSRSGTLVRYYNISEVADTIASGTTYNVGTAIPQGAYIVDGYIQWVTQIIPTNSATNIVAIGVTGDVDSILNEVAVQGLTAGSWSDVIPANAVAAAEWVTNSTAQYLTFTFTSDGTWVAPTAGVAMVYLDYIHSNPPE